MSTTTDRRPEWLQRVHGKTHATDGGPCFCDLITSARTDRKPRAIDAIDGEDGRPVPLATQEDARRVKNRVYSCARRVGDVSVIMSEDSLGIAEARSGRWVFRFRCVSKTEGDSHVATLAEIGAQLAYNPAEKKPRAARRAKRQIEAELMAERRGLQQVMHEAVHGETMPSPDDVPLIGPAPPGFCDACGKALHGEDLRRGAHICAGDEVLLELIKAPGRTPTPEHVRKAAEPAEKAPDTARKALADFWDSIS